MNNKGLDLDGAGGSDMAEHSDSPVDSAKSDLEFVLRINLKTAKRVLIVLSSLMALSVAAGGGYLAGKSSLQKKFVACVDDLKDALSREKKLGSSSKNGGGDIGGLAAPFGVPPSAQFQPTPAPSPAPNIPNDDRLPSAKDPDI